MGLKVSNFFSVDKDKALNGVRIDMGSGAAMWIAQMKNANMIAFIQKGLAPYQSQLKIGTLDPKILEEVTFGAVATHIIKNWENFEDREGTPIPYSPEAAEQMLRELPKFAEFVEEQANMQSHYREVVVEDAVGNS